MNIKDYSREFCTNHLSHSSAGFMYDDADLIRRLSDLEDDVGTL